LIKTGVVIKRTAQHKTRVGPALAGLILCLLGISALAQVESSVPEKLRAAISRIDALAAAEHAKDDVGSLTIGVVAGDKLVWTRSYGYADMEKKIPANAETVYRIGSITKSFTGLMLLQLVQDGKVSLSDPVEKYFPELGTIPNRPASAAHHARTACDHEVGSRA
jgi:CubicO group peptidase (beta-lactamase class C family)